MLSLLGQQQQFHFAFGQRPFHFPADPLSGFRMPPIGNCQSKYAIYTIHHAILINNNGRYWFGRFYTPPPLTLTHRYEMRRTLRGGSILQRKYLSVSSLTNGIHSPEKKISHYINIYQLFGDIGGGYSIFNLINVSFMLHVPKTFIPHFFFVLFVVFLCFAAFHPACWCKMQFGIG